MVTINPNHVDLDLHCPIGWSNSQTHILHIKLHHHLPTFTVTLDFPGLPQIDHRYTDHVM